MYLRGESYTLIFPLASALEAEWNVLIHKNGFISQFDKGCEFLADVCTRLKIETSKNDIQNDMANQTARVNRFIEKGYSYQVGEVEMSQLIYRLIKDFTFLQGKPLPEFMLFIRENSKRLGVKN